MPDNVHALIGRLVVRTQSRQLTWLPELALPLTGETPLRSEVKSRQLRLSRSYGLQVFHWGRWETLCDDAGPLEPLLGATGLKPTPDDELTGLIESILSAR